MKELRVRRLLDELDTDLVRRAEATVDRVPDITSELEDKQIRNVMAVAEETQSLAVVDNFIKYQIGRNKQNEGWRFGEEGGQGFGEAIRGDLDWIKQQAKSKAGGDITAGEFAIGLARRYLGYVARYFKYVQVRQ